MVYFQMGSLGGIYHSMDMRDDLIRWDLAIFFEKLADLGLSESSSRTGRGADFGSNFGRDILEIEHDIFTFFEDKSTIDDLGGFIRCRHNGSRLSGGLFSQTMRFITLEYKTTEHWVGR